MPPKKPGKKVTIQLRPLQRARGSSFEQDPAAGPSSGAPVKAVLKKSRYKIYEIPRKSEFSEYLLKLRREQERLEQDDADLRVEPPAHEAAGPSRQAEARPKLIMFDNPISPVRQGSVVEYRPKERHPFKELVSNYLRRSSHPKQLLALYKIPVVKNWEQVIEDSLRKMAAERSTRGEQWKQPRLQWLDDLEEANRQLPEPTRRRRNMFDPSICCFLAWFGGRRRRRRRGQRWSDA
ncbi:uncharacterized protein LOC133391105 [Anopheles gambiae]|uniref:uncharacterized protein LOC133391105 n=1 Tax=Anopheles gambiae TaxID=7165 RepID=UPI002AC8B3B8|nr:uncharacterized protein LOC133391105 [Anopheles gambiae]